MIRGLQSPQVCVLATFVTSLACGTLYVYSAYSTQLAERLALTATQTALIGMMGTMGVSLLGAVAGIITDRFGPTVPIISGAGALFLGYMIIYDTYNNGSNWDYRIPLLAFGGCLAGFGSSMAYSASIKAAAMSFPGSRGTAVGFPLAGFGLSAVFFTSMGKLLFNHETSSFLAMLACLTAGLCLITVPFVRLPQESALPAPLMAPSQSLDTLRNVGSDSYGSFNSPVLSRDQSSSALDETAAAAKRAAQIQQKILEHDLHHNYTIWEMFKTIEFWSQFMVLGLLAGVGQMYIYCCGYIVRALITGNATPDAGPLDAKIQSVQALQVALISLSSFTGRFISGFVSDVLTRHLELQRLWMVFFATLISLISNIAMAYFVKSASILWLISLIIGLSYGMMFGVFPTIVCDTFGIQHFSKNWGFVGTSPVFTIFVFNKLFGTIYDENSVIRTVSNVFSSSKNNDVTVNTLICLKGSQCYAESFEITTAVTVFTLILISWMIYTEKHQPTYKHTTLGDEETQHQSLLQTESRTN